MTTMELIAAVAGAAVASTGFWEFIKWICGVINKKKHTPQEEAMLALLHDRLYYLLGQFSKQPSISPDDYDNMIHLYKAYRALDGNGLIQKMFEQIADIPVK